LPSRGWPETDVIEGLRKPDPVLDAWMRGHGLLEDAVYVCPDCHGTGSFWRVEYGGNGGGPSRMLWHTCGCALGAGLRENP
jgi:hypothetical protein